MVDYLHFWFYRLPDEHITQWYYFTKPRILIQCFVCFCCICWILYVLCFLGKEKSINWAFQGQQPVSLGCIIFVSLWRKDSLIIYEHGINLLLCAWINLIQRIQEKQTNFHHLKSSQHNHSEPIFHECHLYPITRDISSLLLSVNFAKNGPTLPIDLQ